MAPQRVSPTNYFVVYGFNGLFNFNLLLKLQVISARRVSTIVCTQHSDWNFSGTTQPGVVGSRHVRAYRVSGGNFPAT
jgi:hypothetical protein